MRLPGHQPANPGSGSCSGRMRWLSWMWKGCPRRCCCSGSRRQTKAAMEGCWRESVCSATSTPVGGQGCPSRWARARSLENGEGRLFLKNASLPLTTAPSSTRTRCRRPGYAEGNCWRTTWASQRRGRHVAGKCEKQCLLTCVMRPQVPLTRWRWRRRGPPAPVSVEAPFAAVRDRR